MNTWLNTELQRHVTPYYAPLYIAQAKGYFKEQSIKVAILEPNDPSDVTEIIGSGKVDMGFKAMIHTLAVIFQSSIRYRNTSDYGNRLKPATFLFFRWDRFLMNISLELYTSRIAVSPPTSGL